MNIDNPHIRVLALKKAEMSDEIILRMVELDGEAAPACPRQVCRRPSPQPAK